VGRVMGGLGDRPCCRGGRRSRVVRAHARGGGLGRGTGVVGPGLSDHCRWSGRAAAGRQGHWWLALGIAVSVAAKMLARYPTWSRPSVLSSPCGRPWPCLPRAGQIDGSGSTNRDRTPAPNFAGPPGRSAGERRISSAERPMPRLVQLRQETRPAGREHGSPKGSMRAPMCSRPCEPPESPSDRVAVAAGRDPPS
jgi:hypothetical protein